MEWLTWIFMEVKWLITDFPKPENLTKLVNYVGPFWIYAALAGIVFAETGLLVGFFLPGDSLLFACGMLAAQEVLNIFVLNVVLMAAAIIGDALNYALGYKMGARVYSQGNLWFIKHDHLMAAKAFYERHGGKAIILARFVPLVRTFTPFVAGVARMNYGQFVWFNIAGGVGWVISMTFAGYFLGSFDFVKIHFEKIVIGIILVSILPIVFHAFQHWLAKRRAAKLGEPVPGETHSAGPSTDVE
jgi:membrane-associated protein